MTTVNIEKREDRILLEVRENNKCSQNRVSVLSLTIDELKDYNRVGHAIMNFGRRVLEQKEEKGKR